MKRFALSFTLLSGLLFCLAQCGAADEGTKFADTFFSTIMERDFEKAAEMVELPGLNQSDLIDDLKRLENNSANGQLKSFKKSIGFKTNISNGVTTVQLPYTLTYEYGDQSFNVVIEDRGRGNKIVSVR